MGFLFRTAEKISDPKSAEQLISKYLNQETPMSLDAQSFLGTIIKAKADTGTLIVEFTWVRNQEQDLGDVEHVQRYAQSRVGTDVRFKVGTEELVGILSGITVLPEGATVERYINSPFALTFTFSAQDQDPLIAGSKNSGIIGIEVPGNIVDHLHIDPALEYEPHITVCYFPSITDKEVEKILPLAVEAASAVGTFEVLIDGCTTFPTKQEDGTYPHVAKIKSQGLLDFHDLFVDMCEHRYPGLLDLTFTLKNYKPHVTLSYVKDPNAYTPTKALAWSVDHFTLNVGKEEKFPIPIVTGHRKNGSVEMPYLQVADTRIPITIDNSQEENLLVSVKDPSHQDLISNLEGEQVFLVTNKAKIELSITDVKPEGQDTFRIMYRSVDTYIPREVTSMLRFVEAVAKDRGLAPICLRLAKLLSFDKKNEDEAEPEDVDGMGPGGPGTMLEPGKPMYVRSPQTMEESRAEGSGAPEDSVNPSRCTELAKRI